MRDDDDISQNDMDNLLNNSSGGTTSQSSIDDLFAEPMPGQSGVGGGMLGGGQHPGSMSFESASTLHHAGKSEKKPETHELEAVYDVPVQISAVLGRSTMPVHQLLKLGRGAVVELDRRVGEAIDIYVNNRLVARGEVVVVDDHLGVTMTEIIKSERS